MRDEELQRLKHSARMVRWHVLEANWKVPAGRRYRRYDDETTWTTSGATSTCTEVRIEDAVCQAVDGCL